ncbi:MAG: sigma-54 dependent transcriptional regulator [Spirochaetales bacterium]
MKEKKSNPLPAPILIVDDDELFVEYLKTVLEGFGFSNTRTAYRGKEALAIVENTECSLVLLDLLLPDISGLTILETLHNQYPQLPVVVITAKDKVETAVECMKKGAFDFLTKPLQEERLLPILRHALTIHDLRRQVSQLQSGAFLEKLHHPEAFTSIITKSPLMLEVFTHIEAIAPTSKTVLITGESGTGKELIARTIHSLSGRKGKFVPVNIAGLDDTLFSDTLFGHAKGAYTGAHTERNGLIQEAAEGTLFLDEIGDLEPPSQVKLLRLLQEGEYYRLGSDVPQYSQARILAATNSDLFLKVSQGTFRSDLYYRLVAHRIELPPLRSRLEDLPLLVDAFVQKASEELGKPKPLIPQELYAVLSQYPFPGNIRELQSLLYDAVSRTEGKELNRKSLLAYLNKFQESSLQKEKDREKPLSYSALLEEPIPTLEEVEDRLIQKALTLTQGNQSEAAKLLGISQSTLSRWLQKKKKNTPLPHYAK